MRPVAVLFLFLLPLSAGAALPPPEEAELEEVIVTARHVPEDAARVPLSIDVATTAQLGPGGVEDLASLAMRFPGVAFESLWGGTGAAVMLRGLSQPSTAGDNVGVFVDNVYQAGRSSMDVDMLDLERVEVVRGPQNTLFGRSSFAGAIRMVPARPTAAPYLRLQADLGTDALGGVRVAWSQPIGQGAWRARAAASAHRREGTFEFDGEDPGGSRQRAVALTLERQSPVDTRNLLSVHLRLGDTYSNHPASTTLAAEDFNCGARDERSGYWSHFCGAVPMPQPAALSEGLPDSHAQTAQASVRLSLPIGTLQFSSLSSYYFSDAVRIRDFDGGTQGLWSGVCTIDVNCTSGAGAPVTRYATPNVVSRQRQRVSDWSQQLRLGGGGARMNWMLGVAGSWTRTLDTGAFGADRGDLQPDERLTAVVAISPAVVGPFSQLNRALVDDSTTAQLPSSETYQRWYSLAAFGMIEVPVGRRVRTRLELRAERERLHVDPRVAGFSPVTDPDPPPGTFQVVTPRLSLDFQPAGRWYGFASIARGARSGGMNTLPGLAASERSYGPEYNWTTELGMRHAGAGVLRELQLTAYRVDWRNTQIMGVATTPGVAALVMHNTAGILARGIEANLRLRAGRHINLEAAWSLADGRYRAGSDDAGARQICGLASQPPGSDFCAFGPPRSGNDSLPLVPYLDGNRTARAPGHSWNVSITSLPLALGPDWSMTASAMLAAQGNVAERPVGGARYGERRLLSARLALHRDRWQLLVWGSNLTDERYLRAAASRGAAFYPQSPRPIDLLYGEGRRVGLTFTFEAGG